MGASNDCVCLPSGTPKSVQCAMEIINCSNEPDAGFGYPVERQRERNKNRERNWGGKSDVEMEEREKQKENRG